MSPGAVDANGGGAGGGDDELLPALMQVAPDGIMVVDPRTGRLLAANPRLCELLGYTPEELLQLTVADTYLREELHDCEGRLRELEAGPTLRFERRMRGKHGVVTVETSATRLGDGRCLAIVRDVTERKRTEDELREARALAESADRARSALLASMNHELRTPLNAIIGFSALLEGQKGGPLTERQRRYAQNILTSGRQLLDLIDMVLDLTTAPVGRTEVDAERFVVCTALREVEGLARRLAAAKLQVLTVDAGPESLAIRADKAKFKHIVYELLGDAICFTPESGRVHLTVRALTDGAAPAPGEWLEVAVADTRVGMPPEEQARTRLAFARQLVKAHGGRLHVESDDGRGTTATVLLPVAPEGRR